MSSQECPTDNAESRALLQRFVNILRESGVSVCTSRTINYAAATAVLDGDVYWAGRLTLIHRHEDIAIYDQVFAAYFDGSSKKSSTSVVKNNAGAEEVSIADDDCAEEGIASPHEILVDKDFAEMDVDELIEVSRMCERLSFRPPTRVTSRWRSSNGGSIDMRKTVDDALRRGGDPTVLRRRRRRRTPRPVIFVLDLSRSMQDYARPQMMFALAASRYSRGRSPVSIFSLGTRITPLNHALRHGDIDSALREALTNACDWNAGTRLGNSIGELNSYARAGIGRGAVVVIFSDGLDQGSPDELASQMEILARVVRKVVWVNPLKADPQYQPLQRAMRAALPYVDNFLSGHNMRSLNALCEVLRDAAS